MLTNMFQESAVSGATRRWYVRGRSPVFAWAIVRVGHLRRDTLHNQTAVLTLLMVNPADTDTPDWSISAI